jgi:hypothetical protein
VALFDRSTPLPRFIKLAGVIGTTPLVLFPAGTGGGGMSWFRSTGLGVDGVEAEKADCEVVVPDVLPEEWGCMAAGGRYPIPGAA